MYIIIVALLMFVLPIGSVMAEKILLQSNIGWLLLVGQWFVFWGIGVRLSVAGLRQMLQPRFTAEEIFELKEKAAYALVQELGFANLCLGVIGVCSLFHHAWVLPAAVAGGLYYGLAGVRHLFNRQRNLLENVATYTDLAFFAVVAIFVVGQL